MGLIIGFVLGVLLFGLVIWIVGRLNLGMTVEGYVPAVIAAVVIAIVTWLVMWLLGLFGITVGGGWLGAIVSLVISAVVLLISDRFVSGMKVNGFVGALIAAVAIGVVYWLIDLVLGMFGLA